MDGVASLWGFQEGIDDLNYRLLFTTLELEATRTSAEEKMRKSEEEINQLVQLVQITVQQRDEARDQLQKLQNKLALHQHQPVIPLDLYHQNSPTLFPARGTASSVTESDCHSDTTRTHANHPASYGTSPVNSLLDPSSSPDLSSNNRADSNNAPFDYTTTDSNCPNPAAAPAAPAFDIGAAIIDQLAMKKPLPEKGKFVEAMREAVPLLKTLLVAGCLPQWRNPPPLQPVHIPPIVNACAIGRQSYMVQGASNAIHCESPTGGSRFCSSPAPSFAGVGGLCARKRPLVSASACVGDFHGHMGKRQRSQ